MLAENLVETCKPSQVNSTHELHNVHFQQVDESRTVEPTEINVGMLNSVIFYCLLPYKNGIVLS